jgi:hypothetical protein
MTRGASCRGCGELGAAHVEQLEPEGLDPVEHAEERRLIGDLAAKHGLGGRRRPRQAVERGQERLAQAAANRDLVLGWLHGAAASVPPV